MAFFKFKFCGWSSLSGCGSTIIFFSFQHFALRPSELESPISSKYIRWKKLSLPDFVKSTLGSIKYVSIYWSSKRALGDI